MLPQILPEIEAQDRTELPCMISMGWGLGVLGLGCRDVLGFRDVLGLGKFRV